MNNTTTNYKNVIQRSRKIGFGQGWKRSNKYGAEKVSIDGHNFDSKTEAEYYTYLKTLNLQGQLVLIELQPKVYMTDARILYKPDFLIEIDNERIYIDVKGFKTKTFAIKMRLWKYYGPGKLWIVTKAGKDFKIDKAIMPENKKEK